MLEQDEKDWIYARFVEKEDCNKVQSDNAKKFANDDTRIKLFDQQLGTWNKLFWVIATATAGQLMATIFSMIGGK